MTSTSRKNRLTFALFVFLFAAPFLIGGGLVAILGLRDIQRATSSASWPHIPGRMVESTLSQSGGGGHASGMHGGPGTFNYYPKVEYAYTVNGKAYVGERVAFSLFWSHRSSQNFVDVHSVNSTQPVYFSPGNPADSVLLPGLRQSALQQLIVATLVLSFAMIFVLAGCQAMRWNVLGISSATLSTLNLGLIASLIVYLFLTA